MSKKIKRCKGELFHLVMVAVGPFLPKLRRFLRISVRTDGPAGQICVLKHLDSATANPKVLGGALVFLGGPEKLAAIHFHQGHSRGPLLLKLGSQRQVPLSEPKFSLWMATYLWEGVNQNIHSLPRCHSTRVAGHSRGIHTGLQAWMVRLWNLQLPS